MADAPTGKMPDDSTKKETNNVHVLPFKSKRRGKKETKPSSSAEKPADFSQLAHRLEERIGKIETDLKDSIQMLETDLQRLLKTKKLEKDDKTAQKDLEVLAKQLENRVNKTLSVLSKKEVSSQKNRELLKLIKQRTSQVIKLLSLDFYKNVIGSLGHADYEEEVDPFGMDVHLVEKIKPLFDFLYYKYWRITTTGVDHIPDKGKALIVANHSGTVPYDGAMIKTSVLNEHAKRKDARFLVEDFVYHMPILGTFMYRIGGVRACPENAKRLLDEGHLVVVFPEGVKGIGKYYRQRYKLQRFGRGGFIKLCMQTQSPLIPVGVVGAEEIHPIVIKSNILAKTIGVPYIPITPTFPLLGLLGCIPLPTKWSIHFGEPIEFAGYSPKAIQDELLVHKLSEKVRIQIQEIIFGLLKKRRSVWMG